MPIVFNPFTKKLTPVDTNIIPPGTVASLTGNSGGAVGPTGNNINVVGSGDITIVGNPGTSTLTASINNQANGTVTTSNATPTNIITFALGATPGVYSISGTVVLYDTTDTVGGSFDFSMSIRTTGAAGQIIGAVLDNTFLEPAVTNADISISTSSNNLVLNVVGIAATTIDWLASFNYRFVS